MLFGCVLFDIWVNILKVICDMLVLLFVGELMLVLGGLCFFVGMLVE